MRLRKLLTLCGALVVTLSIALLLPLVAAAQDVGGVIDQLCSDKAGTAGIITYALGTIGGASLLANLRRFLPAPVVTILDLVAANWFRIFEALSRSALNAPPPITRAPAIVLMVLAAGLALSACSTAQLQASNSQAAGLIATACAYEPAITGMVAASGNATAASTQAYATAFCRSPVIDAQSAAWLKATQESAAAQVGVPMVLPSAAPAS